MKCKVILLVLMVTMVGCTADRPLRDKIDSSTPLVLTEEQDRYPLGLHLELLEDPSGELTIEDVTSPEYDSQFVPSQVEAPNYGFTDSAYWVRLRLRNQTRTTDHWLLEAGLANMQYVDLYVPQPEGEEFTIRRTGALRPPSSRDIRHPRMLLNLDISTDTQPTIYVRFQSGTVMNLPLTLWKPDAFWAQSQVDQLLSGLFFGALVVLLAYNLFLYLSLRERSYLYLVILLASITIFESGYAGYTEIYIFPRLYHLKLYYQALSLSMVFVSMLLFTDEFLELRAHHPKIHWVIMALVGVWGILLILTPFLSYRVSANLMVPWALPSTAAILVAGITSWYRGFPYARFFMIAWSGLLVALFLSLFARLGVIPVTVVTENAFRLGLIWMAVCWSIALAHRINVLKAATDAANRALRNSEHRLSQILEGLPLGVVVYGQDRRPSYANQRVVEILSNEAQGIKPDLSAARTLAEAMKYFSLKVVGGDQDYPIEKMPIYRALLGEPASADDVEADLVDRRVPLEIWASPVKDGEGNVESAIVAFQDISLRKRAEAEVDSYRTHLEGLVKERTAQLSREAAEREALALMQTKLIRWLSVINEIHQSLGGTSDRSHSYQRLSGVISQLLGAKWAFIGMWNRQSERIEVQCCLRPDNGTVAEKTIPIVWDTESPLHREIEQGKLLFLPAERTSELLAPLDACLQDEEIQSVILAPFRSEPAVTGLLGIGMPRSADTFTDEEVALIERIEFDLANLAEYARLYETAQELVAAEERNRLARDLHDSVTQVLFSATLLADLVPIVWHRDPEDALQKVQDLRSLTHGALAEMRTMLLELRPAAVITTPLAELLSQLAEAVTSRTEMSPQLHLQRVPPLPEEVHIAFYRIAQEALNNVVKHAEASYIDVTLSATPLRAQGDSDTAMEVRMVIKDDGVGYATDEMYPNRLGIGIMHERTAAIGATLSIESQPGSGTQVSLVWRNDTGIPS